MNSKQNLNEDWGGGSALNDGLCNPSFGKQDVEQRRKNAIARKNEANRLGMDRAELEWAGYISALDWVIGCMDA